MKTTTPPEPVDARGLVADLETARELIQEAKGAADGPDGGFVTDHLDFAEHWIGKVQAALSTANAPTDAPLVGEDGKLNRLPDELAEPYTPDPVLISREVERLKAAITAVERPTDALDPIPSSAREARLWLWRNHVDGRPEYWAFDNPFPCETAGGDPLTLGEPCGWALLKPSVNGRPDYPVEEVERRVTRLASTTREPALDNKGNGDV